MPCKIVAIITDVINLGKERIGIYQLWTHHKLAESSLSRILVLLGIIRDVLECLPFEAVKNRAGRARSGFVMLRLLKELCNPVQRYDRENY